MKKKFQKKSCKIFEWFSGSVGTKQNQTERLSQKAEPNHKQMFFEIRSQTKPKPEPNPKELEPVATLVSTCDPLRVKMGFLLSIETFRKLYNK